jgi:hypothetical protein
MPRVSAPSEITPPRAGRARHELSRRTVGRLLLAAGAVLVVIAISAFTVASWSSIGPLGRCAILLAATGVILVVPVWLKRRVLNATAESVAAIGLALTVADAYLTRQLFAANRLPEAAELFALAAAVAVVAALWAGYGAAAGLKAPRLGAIVAAQFPGVIVAVALVRAFSGTTISGPVATALVLTSAADFLVTRWMGRHEPGAMALSSGIAATVTWVAAVLLAATVLLAPHVGAPVAPWMSATFVMAGATGVGLMPVSGVSWLPLAPVAAVSGGLLAIGLAVPAAVALPSAWETVPFALAGVVVAATCPVLARVAGTGESPEESDRSTAPGGRLRLVAAGSVAIAGAAGLIEVPAALSGMFPLQRLTDAWSGPAFPPRHLAISLVSGALAPAVVLGLVSLACWAAPLQRQSWPRPAALAVAALAAGSIPAAGLTGWAILGVPTLAAGVLLGASALRRPTGRDALATVAACSGVALAVSAALWSLTWAAATVIELAALAVIFCVVAASAAAVGQIGTGCAVAATAGLAWTAPLASGWPAQHGAFAVLCVAVGAVATATLLRRGRPGHAVVLDIGAGLVALLAAMMTGQHAGTFAIVASIAALAASSNAWLRTGQRRLVVLCGATFAALAAVAAEGRPLALALFRPYARLAAPWHGPAQAPIPGLALAVIVVGTCAVAMITAVGAWRGGRASLDAVAIALALVVAPAGAASGLRYWLIVGLLLALALALTAWTSASRSLAPAGAALAAATLALAWALAAAAPTLIVLGFLSAAYPLCGWRARRADVQAAMACLSVLSAAALAEAAALAAGWPAWWAGLAVLGVAACAHLAAALIVHARDQVPLTSTVIEATAWLAVVAGTVQCLDRPGPASLALAISGLLCVGVAARADRRPMRWLGAALCQAAWCVWLFAAGVNAPEAYTVPAAAAWLAYGWHLARRRPRLSSWATYGPGLALLLLPSLIAVWQGPGWIRALTLGLEATAITLIGARIRRQAPLLTGTAVTALDASHELAPAILRLAHTVPAWLPIAVTGAILLWAGATYEARMRNLSALRKIVGAMR